MGFGLLKYSPSKSVVLTSGCTLQRRWDRAVPKDGSKLSLQMVLEPALIIWNFLFDCITCAVNTEFLNRQKKICRQNLSDWKDKIDVYIYLPCVI
jgi:hypothetical protein